MDMNFKTEQEVFRKKAREFLEQECPKSMVWAMEDDERGYSPALWQRMAEMGWMRIILPREHGSKHGNFLDLVVLLEEMGRVLLPGPFFSSVVLGGYTLLDAGNEEQRKNLLMKLTNGDIRVTLALIEPDVKCTFGLTANEIQLKAVKSKDSYLIEGTKLFVLDANVADYMVVAARTKKPLKPVDGVSLFIVGTRVPGVSINALPTIARDKQCEVAFDNVTVPRENILGRENEGWGMLEKVLQKAIVAKSAEMLGIAQVVLEMSVQYAKERFQFGRAIGSFQDIQHYCADMATGVEGMRLLIHKAAWMINEGLPCAQDVAMAKAWASDTCSRVLAAGNQIHGGIAFEKQSNIQLYFRRANAAQALFGNTHFHRESVIREIGL
jgi:alkylation response protein AidB-like acyl-CoA dehydrogenase